MATKHSQPDDCLTFLEQANSSSESKYKIVARFGNTLKHGSLDEFLNIFTRYFFFHSCSMLSLMGFVFTRLNLKTNLTPVSAFGLRAMFTYLSLSVILKRSPTARFLPIRYYI